MELKLRLAIMISIPYVLLLAIQLMLSFVYNETVVTSQQQVFQNQMTQIDIQSLVISTRINWITLDQLFQRLDTLFFLSGSYLNQQLQGNVKLNPNSQPIMVSRYPFNTNLSPPYIYQLQNTDNFWVNNWQDTQIEVFSQLSQSSQQQVNQYNYYGWLVNTLIAVETPSTMSIQRAFVGDQAGVLSSYPAQSTFSTPNVPTNGCPDNPFHYDSRCRSWQTSAILSPQVTFAKPSIPAATLNYQTSGCVRVLSNASLYTSVSCQQQTVLYGSTSTQNTKNSKIQVQGIDPQSFNLSFTSNDPSQFLGGKIRNIFQQEFGPNQTHSQDYIPFQQSLTAAINQNQSNIDLYDEDALTALTFRQMRNRTRQFCLALPINIQQRNFSGIEKNGETQLMFLVAVITSDDSLQNFNSTSNSRTILLVVQIVLVLLIMIFVAQYSKQISMVVQGPIELLLFIMKNVKFKQVEEAFQRHQDLKGEMQSEVRVLYEALENLIRGMRQANIDFLNGKEAESLLQLSEACKFQGAIGNLTCKTICSNNIGNLQQRSERFGEAIASQQEAITTAQTFNNYQAVKAVVTNTEIVNTQNEVEVTAANRSYNLGMALLEQGKQSKIDLYAMSLSILLRAKKIYEQNDGCSNRYACILMDMSIMYTDMNKRSEAEQYLLNAHNALSNLKQEQIQPQEAFSVHQYNKQTQELPKVVLMQKWQQTSAQIQLSLNNYYEAAQQITCSLEEGELQMPQIRKQSLLMLEGIFKKHNLPTNQIDEILDRYNIEELDISFFMKEGEDTGSQVINILIEFLHMMMQQVMNDSDKLSLVMYDQILHVLFLRASRSANQEKSAVYTIRNVQEQKVGLRSKPRFLQCLHHLIQIIDSHMQNFKLKFSIAHLRRKHLKQILVINTSVPEMTEKDMDEFAQQYSTFKDPPQFLHQFPLECCNISLQNNLLLEKQQNFFRQFCNYVQFQDGRAFIEYFKSLREQPPEKMCIFEEF